MAVIDHFAGKTKTAGIMDRDQVKRNFERMKTRERRIADVHQSALQGREKERKKVRKADMAK